jgi:hypothetical protein
MADTVGRAVFGPRSCPDCGGPLPPHTSHAGTCRQRLSNLTAGVEASVALLRLRWLRLGRRVGGRSTPRTQLPRKRRRLSRRCRARLSRLSGNETKRRRW